MDNPISINLGDDNPMKSLSFYWKAEFKNGEVVNQFDGGLDINYKKIKENLSEVRWFILYNKNNSLNRFLVDLENGFIYHNNINQDFSEPKIKVEKNNIRLIHTRRRRVTVCGTKQTLQIHYVLGFQYNDKNGNNRQNVLEIDNEGNWTFIGD